MKATITAANTVMIIVLPVTIIAAAVMVTVMIASWCFRQRLHAEPC